MTVTVTSVDRGAFKGDNSPTVDDAYDAFGKVNTNDTNLKTAVEELQGRHWTVQDTATTLALGKRYKVVAPASTIAFTMPSTFAASSTAENDIWVHNVGANDQRVVTLTPGSGDTFFYNGNSLGVDATWSLGQGQLAIISIRADNTSWDLTIYASLVIDDITDNLGIGLRALTSTLGSSGAENTSVGSYSGSNLTTGNYNTFFGVAAGDFVQTGDFNLCIGYEADVPSISNHHQVNIGDFITGRMSAQSDVDISEGMTISGPSAYGAATVNENAGPLIFKCGAGDDAGLDGTVKIVGPDDALAFEVDGNGITNIISDMVITEQADHASTPAAGFGTLWVKSDTPNKLIFTDDAGTDFELGSGGFTSFVDNETDDNYAIGPNALDSVTASSGLRNIAWGRNAGTAITTSDDNVMIGDQAGALNGDDNNVFIGSSAAATSLGYDNVVIGKSAGAALGYLNVAVGMNALQVATTNTNYCTAIGYESLKSNTDGNDNTAIGYNSGWGITTGEYNACLGQSSGGISTASYCLFIGTNARSHGDQTTDYQLVIGDNNSVGHVPFVEGHMTPANADVDYSAKNITITGTSAKQNASTNLDAGDLILQGGLAATTGIGIGGDLVIRGGAPGSTGTAGNAVIQDGADNTKQIKIDASGITTATTRTLIMPDSNVTLVDGAITASSSDTLTNKTFDANGTGNSLSNVDVADLANGTDGELITWDATGAPTTVDVGTATQVLTSNGPGAAPTFQDASGGFTSFLDDETYDNYAIGPGALDSITLGSGVDNIAIGRNAGTALTINDGNVIIGDEAGTGVDDEYNVIVGKGAGASCGWSNVILGYQALISGTSSASNNVIIGKESAGGATNPSGCVLIGYDVALDLTDAQDSICIGASAGNDLISGDYCIAIGKANKFSSATDDSQIIIGSVHDSIDFTQPFIKGYQPLTRLSTADNSGNNITITGSSARYNAPTYLDAGDLILQGGLAATTGSGIGGDLVIRGGSPGSTGTAGNAIIQDGADNTKEIKIDVSGLTTATTRTLTIPDLDIDLADEDFSVDVETVANQDYIMWWDAPWAGEVTKVRTKSQSGTCTLTGKVNTTALGGTANSVSTSAQEQTHSSSNTFSKGDKLLFTISSNSGCTDMAVIFYLKRT